MRCAGCRTNPDHMQVCTSLQTDNHASTSPVSFFTSRMPFLPPNQQRQSTEGQICYLLLTALLLLKQCCGLSVCLSVCPIPLHKNNVFRGLALFYCVPRACGGLNDATICLSVCLCAFLSVPHRYLRNSAFRVLAVLYYISNTHRKVHSAVHRLIRDSTSLHAMNDKLQGSAATYLRNGGLLITKLTKVYS